MEQFSIFDLYPQESKVYKIDKPIRLIELFSGIGAQAKALKNIGANFEHYKTSEWDIQAVRSYRAVHMGYEEVEPFGNLKENAEKLFKMGVSVDGKTPLTLEQILKKGNKWVCQALSDYEATNNLGSITNIHGKDLEIKDTEKYAYLLTYSFPCQDLSICGLHKGMSKEDSTRSGLLWEVERILRELAVEYSEMPQILVMENVDQVIGSSNIEDFKEWLEFLNGIGYTNTYKVLNAKDFGIPQSRARCFMVSIYGDYNVKMPEGKTITTTMKVLLDDEVEPKYYVLTEKAHKLIDKLIRDHKILTNERTNERTNEPISFCTNAEPIETAYCIKAGFDKGIQNRNHEGNGVCEITRLDYRQTASINECI